MQNRIYWNEGWKFTENFTPELLEKNYDDAGCTEVRLPHTCKETPYHYFDEGVYQMVSGYLRSFFAQEEWRGKRAVLTIEAAGHVSTVYLNGVELGVHSCGYTAYSVELSTALCYGEENVLVIKVDSREQLNVPPFGFVIDYMTYGGIYREVYLELHSQCYISDVFHSGEVTEIIDDKARLGNVRCHTAVTLDGYLAKEEESTDCRLKLKLRKQGNEMWLVTGEIPVKKEREELSVIIEQAELWAPEQPVLYEVLTELWQGEELLETRTERIGFRKAEFREDGFYLNGEKYKIRGLNRHQSYPYVGYAMPASMQRLDADILKKELGVNAVRTSHYPQSHDFMDRCDELGLLVFTELPGWQHIGDEKWKAQAVENVRDMILQYRNHTSVILWGVRINESQDDDAFYMETNRVAHETDPTRPTGGVRANKKSHLFEDVYTYNDFVHEGNNPGCEKKKKVTSNRKKPYLISEYNGHMYPTKAFDDESHRADHALRHANVLDAVAKETDIAGSFGWCMADYNTHKDFGSGDRICYHGVLDMFRNPKLAAAVYACQQEETLILELSSSMDIGEHPGCNRGNIWIFSNADSVKMYKNDRFIKEYHPVDSPYKNLKHGPMLVDDFIGDAIEQEGKYTAAQRKGIKEVLNSTARFGMAHLPKSALLAAARLIVLYRMKMAQAVDLYTRYVGDWGGAATTYRFDAIKNGKVVRTLYKKPMTKVSLRLMADHHELEEDRTYDVAAVRIRAVDECENLLSYYQEPIQLLVEGPAELIGPSVITLHGGMGGTYLRTTGKPGKVKLTVSSAQTGAVTERFSVHIKCNGTVLRKEQEMV